MARPQIGRAALFMGVGMQKGGLIIRFGPPGAPDGRAREVGDVVGLDPPAGTRLAVRVTI